MNDTTKNEMDLEKGNINLEFYIKSYQGRKRNSNQDGYVVKVIPPDVMKSGAKIDLEKDSFLVCIGDGVGGGQDGGEASSILVKTATYYFSSKYVQKYSKKELIEMIIQQTNKKIIQYMKLHKKDWMGTTVVIVIFEKNKLHLSWIGDSRAYVFHHDKLTILSWDHTYLWDNLKKGKITQEMAWNKRHSATLRLCLGEDLNLSIPDYIEYDIKKGDIFLFCTDGLTGDVQDKDIETILKKDISLQDKLYLLYDKAIENGSGDDITIFLCKT